jgi:hypothetical protein
MGPRGRCFLCARPHSSRSRYNCGMPFVVKLTGRIGVVCWLSAPNTEGIRTLATRENAGLFQRYEDANVAIRKMPLDTDRSGLVFWVESAD